LLKNTKDIIKKNFFSVIPMGAIRYSGFRSGWFRLIYYLQKKEPFGKVSADGFKTERLASFSPIALKLGD